MQFYRYLTDDRDYSACDIRNLHIGLDDNKNILIDILPMHQQPKDCIVITQDKHELYVAFLSLYESLKQYTRPVETFLSYYDVMDQVSAWRSKFGKNELTTDFPSFGLKNHIDPMEHTAVYTDMTYADPKTLSLIFGGNGDWYFTLSKYGKRDSFGVRLAMSGGASWRVPRLGIAVHNIYHILNNNFSGGPSPTYEQLVAELNLFIQANPRHFFYCGYIHKQED